MPFQSALTSDQLIAHRGGASVSPSYRASAYISVNANTVIYSARVNQAVFLTPAAELAIDGGSGTLADVMVGMTVLISRVNDMTQAFFRGRVRKVPTSTALYINETGASFADNDYVWILEDFDAHIKLPRWGGQILLDWEETFLGLPPIISDIQAAYAALVDSGTGVLTLDLAPTVQAAQAGATISSYLWTIPTGSTITAGSTTTNDITIEFDPGEYWLHFAATDSDGNTLTRHIKVWAHDADNPPTLLAVDNLSISAELPVGVNEGASAGFSATFDAFDDIASVLERTLACIWVHETYNGVSGSQVNNIAIVGRLRSEANTTAYGDAGQDASVSMTLEGPLAILSNIDAPSFEMDYGTGDSDVVIYIDTLTIWRAIWMVLSQFSTFAEVYPVSFADVTDTFIYDILVTQGNDLLASVADMAQSINAVFQMAPDGRCELARRAVMLDSDGRNALTTIANLGQSDIVETINYDRDYRPAVGRVIADGGGFDGTDVTAYIANAPPGAPDDATGDVTLSRQILETGQTAIDEKDELVERAGNALAASQSPDMLRLKLNDGYRWLTPAVDQWYTWTLDGSELVRGHEFTTGTRWWLQAVEVTPYPTGGAVDVIATFVRETSGTPGMIMPYPTIDSGEFGDLGDLGEIGELTPIDTVFTDYDFTASDGGWIIVVGTHTPAVGIEGDCNGGVMYVDASKDFGTPQTVKSVTVTYDATYTGGKDNANRIYIRSSATAAWFEVGSWTTVTGTGNTVSINLQGATVAQVRVVAYAGADCLGSITITDITLELLSNARWTHEFDFLISDHGWTIVPIPSYGNEVNGTYVLGSGFQVGASTFVPGQYNTLIQSPTVLSTTFTRVEQRAFASNATNDNEIGSDNLAIVAFNLNFPPGENTVIWSGTEAATYIQGYLRNGGTGDLSGYIRRVVVSGIGIDPFI